METDKLPRIDLLKGEEVLQDENQEAMDRHPGDSVDGGADCLREHQAARNDVIKWLQGLDL